MVRNRRFVLIVIICAALLGLISSEIFLSFAGFGSYPIYDIDNEIKYIPAANQHGRFLNRNAWLSDRPGWLEATTPIGDLCRVNSLTCIDVARKPTWTESAYKIRATASIQR